MSKKAIKERAAALAKKHLPTHQSEAADQVPDKLKDPRGALDTGETAAEKKHLPTRKSANAAQEPDKLKDPRGPLDKGRSSKAEGHLPTHEEHDKEDPMYDKKYKGKKMNHEDHDKEDPMYDKKYKGKKMNHENKEKGYYDDDEMDENKEKGYYDDDDEMDESTNKKADQRKPATGPHFKSAGKAFDGIAVADDMDDGHTDEKSKVAEGEDQDDEDHKYSKKYMKEMEYPEDDEHEEKAKKEAVGEHVDALVSGEDLSEEFKRKTQTIFEAAVNEQVDFVKDKLVESYRTKLNEAVQEIEEKMAEDVENFLHYVAGEWLQQNELAVETGIQSEINESFVSSLKKLFEDHNIDIPEEKVSLVNELSDEKEKLESELNEALNQVLALRKDLEDKNREDILTDACKGLSGTETDKLKSLAEGVSFENENEYSAKIQVLREGYFNVGITPAKDIADSQLEAGETLTDNNEKSKAQIDGPMAAYLTAATNLANRQS